MMKKIFKVKAISLLLAALLMLVPLLLTSCSDENVGYEWGVSGDEERIWNEMNSYYRYDLPVGYTVKFNPTYYFDDEVGSGYYEDTYHFASYERDGDIVRVEYDGYYTYYVNEEGAASIDALVAGDKSNAALYNSGSMADMDTDVVTMLDSLASASSGAKEVEVSVLYDATRYDIRLYDSTGCVYRIYGALYRYEGGLWYVNYDKLSNDHFDAEGDFSYRRGSVQMYPIDENAELSQMIDNVRYNLVYIHTTYIYEEDEVDTEPENEPIDPELSARGWFWLIYSGLAFALPVWPLLVGFSNAASRDHGRNKRWMYLSIGAGVWLILGIIIAIILS
jgi:hypothetical protein